MLLIAYILALILVVIHFQTVLNGVKLVFHLFTPLFIGIIIAFVFNRPFEMFQHIYHDKWKLGKTPAKILAIVSIYVLAFGVCLLLLSLVIPEVVKNLNMFLSNANVYLQETQEFINRITDLFGIQNFDLSSVTKMAEEYLSALNNSLNDMLPQIVEVTAGFISVAATGIISIALSVYIMSGKDYLLSQLKRTVLIYLPVSARAPVTSLSGIILQVFEDYVAGQCKEAVILGTLCFAGMTILRLDYSGLISVVIAFTALVPIAGAYIGGAIGVILLLFVSPRKAFVFLVFLLILQQFEGNVIYPRVVGRKIGLPGMWVLLSITVGGGLFGIWGMLISVPITTIFYQLLKRDVERREARENAL